MPFNITPLENKYGLTQPDLNGIGQEPRERDLISNPNDSTVNTTLLSEVAPEVPDYIKLTKLTKDDLLNATTYFMLKNGYRVVKVTEHNKISKILNPEETYLKIKETFDNEIKQGILDLTIKIGNMTQALNEDIYDEYSVDDQIVVKDSYSCKDPNLLLELSNFIGAVNDQDDSTIQDQVYKSLLTSNKKIHKTSSYLLNHELSILESNVNSKMPGRDI